MFPVQLRRASCFTHCRFSFCPFVFGGYSSTLRSILRAISLSLSLFFPLPLSKMTMRESSFTTSDDWVRRTCEAIGTRNGVALKDSISRAEAGEAVILATDGAKAISEVCRKLSTALQDGVAAFLQRHPLLNDHRANPNAAEARNKEEQEQCIRTAMRVALTGALVCYQRVNKKAVQQVAGATSPTGTGASAASPIDLDHTTGEIESEEVVLRRSCRDTLLKGLLFAFEAFVSMHAMNRDHYPPRTGNKTTGTVGWDTLVLLHFVHHIPQIAREASGAVIDSATGELVRSWRKLLVALQSVDAGEAAELSRRRGALALVNGLLIIMFQRYNTHQCSVFLSAVEHAESVAKRLGDSSKSILQPSQHMVSEVVTYHYFKGRMLLYERQFAEAHEALREAYRLLPPPPAGHPRDGKQTPGSIAQQRNKQRVRFFLMVAGLLSCFRTPQAILDADPLLANMFAPLVDAVEQGNAVAFSAALELHRSVWRRRGVYLLLQQQGKLLCYLMLIARTHAAVGSIPGKDNSRITLANLLATYHACCPGGATKKEGRGAPRSEGGKRKAESQSGKKRPRGLSEVKEEVSDAVAEAEEVGMDDDRMALWVVKLIARGYLRGYLSHEHKTVVLSKKDPFPLLQAQTPAP